MPNNNSKSCCIIGAAPIPRFPHLPDHTAVFAADGGLDTLNAHGISPDAVIGDFDSLSDTEKLSALREKGCEIITLPVEKDDTDTAFAAKLALSRGYKKLYILGGLGGVRPDHSLANLQTLVMLSKHSALGFLTDGLYAFTAIHGHSRLSFPPTVRGDISVFSAEGEAHGVTLRGMKYKLENATLTGDFPIGVSNSFTGEAATAELTSGSLWICFSCSELPLDDFPTAESLD